MKIAPSILTSDFSKLKLELDSIKNADYIHLDIMDGFFVPNISFGPYISECISKSTDKLLDIHLMVLDPLEWINRFVFKNTEFITIHYEANNFIDAINKIKSLGIKAGVSIKPDTKVSEILDLLDIVDLILVMTVEPGFGGQSFMHEASMKVNELDILRENHNYGYVIEVDGGINDKTIEIIEDYGADIAVVGNYIFSKDNREEIIKKLKK